MSDKEYYSLVETALGLFIEQLQTNVKITNHHARFRVITTLTELRIETIRRLN